MSKVYSLQRMQQLPITLKDAWSFFSNSANLQTITPPYMQFKALSLQQTMYEGQIIEYTVRPLLSIPVYWMTEITHIVNEKYFVDEQRFGPYSFWHHQHHFKKTDSGVEMTDFVHYKIPFWFLGDIANRLFVQKQVTQIFDYRYQKVKELFG